MSYDYPADQSDVAGSWLGTILEAISPVARNLVPAGLIIALLIFAWMALKGRTLRSLRAQLSVFVLVWIAAELPRSLILLGFIKPTPELTSFGIPAHTTSMVVFGVVIVYRFYKLRVSGKISRGQLPDAIHEGLNGVLGESGARAIEFYVDPSIAIKNIAEYRKSLRKLFSVGGEVLETKIAANFYAKLGLQFVEKAGYDLARYVQEASTKRAGL